MKKFNQLCVMQGTTLGNSTPKDFEEFFKEKGFTVKFAEQVKTNELLIDNTYRTDLLFYIEDSEIPRFATWRLEMEIRWWEDVVKYNAGADYYPAEILEKYPINW